MKMLRKCLAARFTSSFKARLSNPFYSRPHSPSPRMIPDRSSPSRVRSAASRPGPLRADLERRAVHEGKGGGSGRVDGPKGNLNFDTDDDGDVDSDDDYWNSGAGWDPIGEKDAPFTADFNGNCRTVSNLFIDRDTEDEVGLFGAVDRSRIRGVILAGVDVTGRDAVGSLLGDGVYGSVVDNHATGQVSGQDEVGGLVGRTWGTVWYSSARHQCVRQ